MTRLSVNLCTPHPISSYHLPDHSTIAFRSTFSPLSHPVFPRPASHHCNIFLMCPGSCPNSSIARRRTPLESFDEGLTIQSVLAAPLHSAQCTFESRGLRTARRGGKSPRELAYLLATLRSNRNEKFPHVPVGRQRTESAAGTDQKPMVCFGKKVFHFVLVPELGKRVRFENLFGFLWLFSVWMCALNRSRFRMPAVPVPSLSSASPRLLRDCQELSIRRGAQASSADTVDRIDPTEKKPVSLIGIVQDAALQPGKEFSGVAYTRQHSDLSVVSLFISITLTIPTSVSAISFYSVLSLKCSPPPCSTRRRSNIRY